MSKITELQARVKRAADLSGSINSFLSVEHCSRQSKHGRSHLTVAVHGSSTSLYLDADESVGVVKALEELAAARAAAYEEAKAPLDKLEAVLNPPPEPTIFNTPNVWFEYEGNGCELHDEYNHCDVLEVGVVTCDSWNAFVEAGKSGSLNIYGNVNGTQCASQIIDAINDINAGLQVSGDPCNAVIIIKRSE